MSSRDLDYEQFMPLQKYADDSGVRLYLFSGGKDNRLSAEKIMQIVPNWFFADFWFCGQVNFGRELSRDFYLKGMAKSDFHQELFNMR